MMMAETRLFRFTAHGIFPQRCFGRSLEILASPLRICSGARNQQPNQRVQASVSRVTARAKGSTGRATQPAPDAHR